MEYVSKESVIAAIKDEMKRDKGSEPYLTGWVQALHSLKTRIEALEPATADVDITELVFRKPKEPVKVNEALTICPTCRKRLKDGHSYCKRCGQAILRTKGDDANGKKA